MARIEKTVFISYRRTDEPWALAIFQDLTQHGYDVFIDYDGIASGNFETAILENIRARAHFLVLLTPTALERCRDPKDWMRREIEAALDSQRNIVPVMLEGFDFATPAIATQLIGKLAELTKYNGLEIPKGYFSPAMERLRNKFLNVSLDTVLHPASLSAQQAATEQKDKVTVALAGELRKVEGEQFHSVAQAEAAAQAESDRKSKFELPNFWRVFLMIVLSAWGVFLVAVLFGLMKENEGVASVLVSLVIALTVIWPVWFLWRYPRGRGRAH